MCLPRIRLILYMEHRTHTHRDRHLFTSSFIDYASGNLTVQVSPTLRPTRIVTSIWNVTAYSWDRRFSSPVRLPVHIFPTSCSNVANRACSPEGVYSNPCDEMLRWEHIVYLRVSGLPPRMFPGTSISVTVRAAT
jgi:hypothetical protein